MRLELEQQLEPSPIRTTEFALAVSVINEQQPPTIGYGRPTVAVAFKAERFSGQDFTRQSDGTLRRPANRALVAHERRRARRRQPACGLWSQHLQVSSLSAARAMSMEWRGNGNTTPGQRPAPSRGRRICSASSFRTGVAGIIGGPACTSLVTSVSRSRQRLGMAGTRPCFLSLLRRFPGPNVPMTVSHGHNDWRAVRALKRPGGSRFDYSVFPNALPPPSVGPLLDRRSLVHLCSLSLDVHACSGNVLLLFYGWLSDCSPLLPFLLAAFTFLLHAIQ